MIIRSLIFGVSGLLVGGCQHNADVVPAVLADDSDETMAMVKSHLAGAMGVAQVRLGVGDPTQTPALTILPPPLGPHETRSPATPTQFNLMVRGDICYAMREGAEEMIELTGVSCRAL